TYSFEAGFKVRYYWSLGELDCIKAVIATPPKKAGGEGGGMELTGQPPPSKGRVPGPEDDLTAEEIAELLSTPTRTVSPSAVRHWNNEGCHYLPGGRKLQAGTPLGGGTGAPKKTYKRADFEIISKNIGEEWDGCATIRGRLYRIAWAAAEEYEELLEKTL